MRRIIAAALLLVMMLGLTACNREAAEIVDVGPGEAPADESVPMPGQEAEPEAAPPQTSPALPTLLPEAGIPADSQAATTEQLRGIAQAFVDCEVEMLYEAIGYPLNAGYAPSSQGPGEDGELIYGGFTVYTYRENGVEKVTEVR